MLNDSRNFSYHRNVENTQLQRRGHILFIERNVIDLNQNSRSRSIIVNIDDLYVMLQALMRKYIEEDDKYKCLEKENVDLRFILTIECQHT